MAGSRWPRSSAGATSRASAASAYPLLVHLGRRRAGIALAFTAALISGFSIYINAIAVREFGNPTLYTTVKNLVAGVLLLSAALALTRSGRSALSRPRRLRQIFGLAAVGVFGGGAAFVLFFEGLARTSASSAGFVQKTLVIWVAIFAVSFLRERFSIAHGAAIAVLVAGQLVALGGVGLSALGPGEAMVFAATLLWAGEVIIAKLLLRELSPLTVACARMGIGSVTLVTFSLASGVTAGLASLTLTQWGWVLLTGLILSAYVATWFAALARAQATDVTAVLVFGAVVTAVISSGAEVSRLAPSLPGLALITVGAITIALLAARSDRMPLGTRAQLR